jgi:16S rRNA (guanine527-N7)-methyltransferase
VSEGLEPEPAAAAVLAGERLPLLRRYTANLAEHGEELGLIGPLERPRLWTRHILNSAVVAPLLRSGGRVADVGSGAGLPGLVLAIILVLIEPMERRVEWLRRQVAELELSTVEVVRARAEEARLPYRFDQVTARAVSALAKLIPITAPLLQPGGELVLLKGAGAEREIEAASKQIRKFRLSEPEVIVLGEGVLSEVTRVVRATVG